MISAVLCNTNGRTLSHAVREGGRRGAEGQDDASMQDEEEDVARMT